MTKTKVNNKKTNGGVQDFLSKLSRGLMLPVALLPVAGLFLGVGAGFENLYKVKHETTVGTWAYIFTIFKMIGDVVFGNLPILFAMGIAIAFANDVGVAAFAAFVGWIIFNAAQSTLIFEYGHLEAISDGVKYLVTDGTNVIYDNAISLKVGYVIKTVDVDGNLIDFVTIDDSNIDIYSELFTFVNDSYNIGFWKEVPANMVGTNVGIRSMQTSAFGGILVGFWAAFMYNRFHSIQLPNAIGFFQGSRFVPIITFLTSILLGLAFVIIWPPIGYFLDWFGRTLAGLPASTDAMLYGGIKRALIPFGLHHVFYTPLWYTSAGGTMTVGTEVFTGNVNIWMEMQSIGMAFNAVDKGGQSVAGYEFNGVIDGLWQWTSTDGTIVTLTQGINPGSYTAGAYPIYMAALPAAGAAMIMASDSDKRQVAASVIFAAVITSFLTGITEPIEFTFLFLAPWLYYGFHVPMTALSFWFAGLMNVHVTVTFSQGIFDFLIFGILPVFSGMHTNVWYLFIIAAIWAPIYYFVFYFAIMKFDIQTPGRGEGSIAMTTKADVKKSKSNSKAGHYGTAEERVERVNKLLEYLGGKENLKTIDACASRLRLTVADRSKLNDDGLVKELGAKGIVGKGTSVQIIFGSEAEILKQELKAK